MAAAPPREIPIPLAVSRILARGPGSALSLRRVDAYSDGCSFRLQADVRREPGTDPDRWDDILEEVRPQQRRHRDLDSGLRIGVTLPDGRTASADRDWRRARAAGKRPDGPTLVLNSRGGGGSSREFTMGFQLWLWPLPPSGPLTLHYQWAALGIDESATELDAALIVKAAAEVTTIWE